MKAAGVSSGAKTAIIGDLLDAGYILVPLRGKIPMDPAWEQTPPGKYGVADFVEGNYGVALKPGDLIIDVDPRHFPDGDNVLSRFTHDIKMDLSKTFVVRTGGGGLHIYLSKPADILVRNGLKEYPGIEFKSCGRQVVGPGSIHPDSGQEYVVASGKPSDIADAPTRLLALIQRTAVPFSELGGTGAYVNDAATQGRYLAYLQDIAEPSVEGKRGDHNAFRVACQGRDLGLPPAVTWELMLEVWNPRCAPAWGTEELKAKVVNAYKYAAGAVGSSHPAASFDAVPETPAKEKEPEIAWKTTAQGGVVKCFQNLLNYMRLPAGGFYKIFAYNDFTGRVEFVNPAPWHRGRMPRYVGVSDDDLKLLKGYLAIRHGFEQPVQSIEEAVTNVAYHDRFHPVREYLDGLRWDGKRRADTWLADYVGAVDGGYPEYLKAISRKTLCAAVMRVFRPGIKFDHVLTLEGAQDIGKSAVCEILGGKWALDAPVDPHSRDTIQMLQGRWIVELAELEVLRKTDEDALKAFITRRHDAARLAYGRTVGEFPRQSIFIATKNPKADGTYLRDDTGNRRWWPVRCEPAHGIGQINFRGLKEVRNQLFAEAVHIVRTPPGEELFMDTVALKASAREVVAQRHADHEWTERIASWIESLDEKPETRRDFLTTREIFLDAMSGFDKQLDRRSSLAIASVMRGIGWTPALKWAKDRPMRGYERKASGQALDKLVDLL